MSVKHEFKESSCIRCKKHINDIWKRFSYNPLYLAISGGKNENIYTESFLLKERERILLKYHKCLSDDEIIIDSILE